MHVHNMRCVSVKAVKLYIGLTPTSNPSTYVLLVLLYYCIMKRLKGCMQGGIVKKLAPPYRRYYMHAVSLKHCNHTETSPVASKHTTGTYTLMLHTTFLCRVCMNLEVKLVNLESFSDIILRIPAPAWDVVRLS